MVWCANAACDFSGSNSSGRGIPVVVVDDEVYRTCPSLVVATVDKFARLPFRGQARTLFGLRDRHSPSLGHLSEADGDAVGGKKARDAVAAPRLLPPELIIQDELHLISGPLGTMVGLGARCRRYHDRVAPSTARYRCTSCGNLTRFDVVERQRTRAYHHFTVGGDLHVAEVDVLESEVESVTCRWCGPSGNVVVVEDGPAIGREDAGAP